ncbi:hypothetical protein [Streptomyces sp. NPDC056672]|uniref:effector-associated constant component EACC1 n=1 Tax=Streptomyces sp. NPDC056672 TaxID=3345906 RepID=UPI0036B33B70
MLDGGWELLVRVGLADTGDPEDVDDAALSLRRALEEVPGLAVREVRTETAPRGSKGLGLELGALVVTVLGARYGLRVVVDAVRVWVERDRHRKVVVRLGDDSLELEGMSPELSRELAETFVRRRTAE